MLRADHRDWGGASKEWFIVSDSVDCRGQQPCMFKDPSACARRFRGLLRCGL